MKSLGRILISVALVLMNWWALATEWHNNKFSELMSFLGVWLGSLATVIATVLFVWAINDWFTWYRRETRWRREEGYSKIPFSFYLKDLMKR